MFLCPNNAGRTDSVSLLFPLLMMNDVPESLHRNEAVSVSLMTVGTRLEAVRREERELTSSGSRRGTLPRGRASTTAW